MHNKDTVHSLHPDLGQVLLAYAHVALAVHAIAPHCIVSAAPQRPMELPTYTLTDSQQRAAKQRLAASQVKAKKVCMHAVLDARCQLMGAMLNRHLCSTELVPKLKPNHSFTHHRLVYSPFNTLYTHPDTVVLEVAPFLF